MEARKWAQSRGSNIRNLLKAITQKKKKGKKKKRKEYQSSISFSAHNCTIKLQKSANVTPSNH